MYSKVHCKKKIYSIVISPRKYLARRAIKNVINFPKLRIQKSRIFYKLQEKINNV